MIALRRTLCLALISALLAGGARAEMFVFPAPSGTASREILVYSSLDERLAAPLIAGFQARNPDIAVRYEDLLTGEIHARITAETDAGLPTADFAFSSAMDLQVKLVNDGYALPVTAPETDDWPDWANWRNTAYAMTFEPAVFVYHKPDFLTAAPPATRAEFLAWMKTGGALVQGRIGTYDIERSGVGYLFLARDQEHFPDIWSVVRAMGAAGVQQFPTSEDILVRISDGRLAMGYNILGSYAADWAREHPDVGLVLPRDYTVVASRIGLVPRAARSPDLGARMLGFFLSRAGQTILAEELRLPAVSLEVSERNSARAMQDTLGGQLRPVPVSPGLLVYLDQAKRARLVARWNAALAGQ